MVAQFGIVQIYQSTLCAYVNINIIFVVRKYLGLGFNKISYLFNLQKSTNVISFNFIMIGVVDKSKLLQKYIQLCMYVDIYGENNYRIQEYFDALCRCALVFVVDKNNQLLQKCTCAVFCLKVNWGEFSDQQLGGVIQRDFVTNDSVIQNWEGRNATQRLLENIVNRQNVVM
eukprot:TRINITY_DN1508_c0_g1_i11.p3 TRINITY_DN1508_c0_g1~~TRINITY_DN1508_c0_g1_i11.p3  ORF type:complete len:172 (-),score=2.64 TRINITY_DN1508_c0_g1_i11:12-527(-)